MTFRDSAEQAVQSNALTFASRVASIVLVPIMLTALYGGIVVLRDHDRAIIEARANREADIARIELHQAQIIALTGRISASEAASAGILARLQAQQDTLVRIERHLERLANGAK